MAKPNFTYSTSATPNPATSTAATLEQQESLRLVIEVISSELELRPLLTTIVRHACVLLHADRGTIGLVVKEKNVIRTEAAFEMPEGELGLEMPEGVGIAGQVLQTKKPVVLHRYGDANQPIYDGMLEDAVIGMPIFWRGEMIGFFGIGVAPPRHFSQEDIDTLSLLARHAAIAIHNAKTFEAEKRRLARITTLSKIGQLITGSLSLETILETTLEAIYEQLHYENVALLLTDPHDPETLVLQARSGIYKNVAEYRQSIYEGIIGAAAQSKKPLLISDVRNDPRYIPIPHTNVQSELALPMVVGDKLLGVLNLETEATLFEEDIPGLGIIATQLGIAVENSRLFEQEKRRALRTAIVSRIGQLITSSLSLNEILQTAVEAMTKQLGYSTVGIFLVSERDEAKRLVLRARSGYETTLVVGDYSQSLGQGVVGRAARERRGVYIPDIRKAPNYLAFPGSEQLRSELALPIVAGERLLGVLNAESSERIDPDDQAGLEIIAGQLGVAIENARLFAETEKALDETQLLFETSQRMSMVLDIDGVVEAYLTQVATRHRYRCTVATFEVDELGEKTTIVTLGRWVPNEGIILGKAQVPYFRDAFDSLLDAGQTVTITHVSEDSRASQTLREAQLERGYPALALIPLIVRGKRIGVVSLSDKERHDWTEVDLRPYQVTAAQLAIALNSRRQQQQLQEGEQRIAVFEERQRIARDLHDSVNQLIFSMTLIAQSLGTAYQRDPAEGDKRMQRVVELSHMVRTEMRSLLVETRHTVPDSSLAGLHHYGLVKALQQHVQEVSKTGLSVMLEANHYQPQRFEVEESLFRITQEAFNNIQKHAKASQVWLSLDSQAEGVHLTIKDDGVGFIVNQAVARESAIGLKSMRERAEAVGASFVIEAAPGQGTKLEVRLFRS
jgi:GAF domain-containing protein